MKTDSDGQADLALRYVLLLRGSGNAVPGRAAAAHQGGFVLHDNLNVCIHHARRSAGEGAQRVVNRLFERIIETRPRTRIHLRNGARIGAGMATASSSGLVGSGP